MSDLTSLQKTLFGLEKVGETKLYQFRKILLITEDHFKLEKEYKEVFTNSSVYTIQRNLDFINTANRYRNCFDLILIDKINFSQLHLILHRFKCRYILFSSCDASLYVQNVSEFKRHEISYDSVIYKNIRQFYDVFMPVGPSDYDIAKASLQNKIDNLPALREIYYCAKKDLNIDAVYISESQYPFTEQDLSKLRDENSERTGWYHAQLKQFYLHSVDQSALDFYVALCTDLFFLKPYELFNIDQLPIYMYGAAPTHPPSIAHMKKLHPQLRCFDGRSAVSHHMIFERSVIEQLLREVNNFSGKLFWQCFIESIDKSHYEAAGASDYDIYFNYLRLIKREILTREPNYLDTGDPSVVKNFDGDFYCDHFYTRKNN